MAETIILEIPTAIVEMAANLTELKRRLYEDIIIAEFQKGNLSIRESAELLGLTYEGFLEWLGRQKLSFITASREELNENYHQFETFMPLGVKSMPPAPARA